MNVSKLKNSQKDRNAETVVRPPVQDKKRVIEYGDVTEEEYYELVRERDVLAQEVLFNRTSADYTAHCFQLLSRYEKYSTEFLDSLQQQYDTAAKTTVALHSAIFEEVEKRSADRKLIEGKLLEIDRTMGEVVNGSRDIVMKVTKNDLEAIDRLLMGSISKINDKLEELEEINRSMQSGYISRLQRIVDTRKEAEAKFLEERQLFTKIVRGACTLNPTRRTSP